MFGLFKKDKDQKASVPATDYDDCDWVAAEGEADGAPMIFRFREHLPSAELMAKYRYLHVLTHTYAGYDEEIRLPSTEEDQQMEALEQALETTVEANSGILVAVITGNYQRQWRYYTNDSDAFMQDVQQALINVPALGADSKKELGIESFDDPEWGALAELLPDQH